MTLVDLGLRLEGNSYIEYNQRPTEIKIQQKEKKKKNTATLLTIKREGKKETPPPPKVWVDTTLPVKLRPPGVDTILPHSTA